MNYVFITPDIYDMGGLQFYVSNKAKWLREHGYQTIVFSANLPNKECQIKELEMYSQFALWPLIYRPYSISPILVKETLKYMLKEVKKNLGEGDTIVESHYAIGACWGELLAQKLHAKNFVFMLGEQYEGDMYVETTDFLKWKYDRHALAGNHVSTIKKVLHDNSIPEDKEYCLMAYEGNELVDINCSIIDELEECDFRIGLLSRMEKGYVKYIFQAIHHFSISHPDKKIQFVAVGEIGSNNGLLDILKDVDNVRLITTGNLTPIPKVFADKIDIAIAGSGCAYLLAQAGAPVIVSEASVYYAMGIYGYDVMDILYSNKTKNYTETEIVDSYVKYLNLWFDKKIDKKDITSLSFSDETDEYLKHFRFQKQMIDDGQYCEILKIKSIRKMTLKENLWPTVYTYFGIKVGNLLNKIVHKNR